ncbi:NAD-dependent epimerase/dehydratase family protein [Solicola sp. PLA-1-18]|uniref:NAD-dependent epimerase/dehydratase family protein n=1 Tax=Solicola sp. PLA-1-18 TaxID=3380532 RepID=UPI003B7B52AF
MRVFVTGATGVMGRAAVHALHSAGHDVVGLARDADGAEVLSAMQVRPATGNLFDRDSLVAAFWDCDAVCNMATHIPVGGPSMRPRAWRLNDRIRSEGSRVVAEAARLAGVKRLVQESVSFVYADGGEEWIDEECPVAVTRAAEPVVLAETHTERFVGATRDGVVLRFGHIVGDDGLTRWRLARARSGHAVGMGRPDSWTHLVHPDDVGSSVLAALTAPSGTYNVGAEPVRRTDVVAAFAEAAGADEGSFYRRSVLRLGGERLEWLMRSQRVSSRRLARSTGWKPCEDQFGVHWFAPMAQAHGA